MRYLILVCAVVMQMCLGATYSWSVYVSPLKHLLEIGQGTAQLPFTVFYFTFPATMVIVGNMLYRIGVRQCAVIGGLIFGSGWILAGWGYLHFTLTVIGIGVLAGIGVGFAYMVPIAVSILWFPDHKGLVTGIAVAGFGGGAALVSQIGGRLMSVWHYTPFETFTALGFAFLILVSLAGLFMSTPPGFSQPKPQPFVPVVIIRDKTFLLLYLCMFTALAAGFAINANLKELSAVITIKTGILGVSLFAVANALGRVSWGWLIDKIPSVTAIRMNLLFQALLLLLGYWMLKHTVGFLLFASIAGWNYGGVLVIYAATVATKWGSNKVGQAYGWLFSANIPAALAPMAAGMIYDTTGSFLPFFWMLATALIIVAVSLRKLGRC